MSHDWLMMTLERRHALITVLKLYFLPKRLHSTKSYFIKAIDHTFYGFTGMITHLGCWENTRKACKSRADRVLPTSRVGYHAGKPIESVVYCLKKRGCLGNSEIKKKRSGLSEEEIVAFLLNCAVL